MRQSGVYTIHNSENGNIYIGSSVDVDKRWYQHRNLLEKGKHHSLHLQRAWNKYGDKAFELKVLVICEPHELLRYEQALIDSRKPEYNCSPTAGSTLGIKQTPEFRKKISIANKGKKLSAETRAKMSIAQMGNKACLGRKHSAETRSKIGKSNKNKTISDETRLKISMAQIGGHRSPETKEKISASMKGRVLSDEHRKNLSLSKIGTKFSQEHCKNIGDSKRGKPLSPEHRAKISAANRGIKHRRKNNSAPESGEIHAAQSE